MYEKIIVPVDLAHVKTLEKALRTAAELAKLYGARLSYLGITASSPGPIAHTPEEFGEKLDAFAKERSGKDGVAATAEYKVVPDPARQLDHALLAAIDKSGADLVVMASHRPGFAEHFFAAHAGHVAAHAKASVMVVR
ncbi:universal stress protein [Jiella sonneratiae]|uniref:Universal stress protein n=1 Tax=Jiella sonneratiae TaxID=2816856 RepID=A0ABS3IZG3_9HYPH|nr:universal stress protein [Jiella sonneratiae]MBO0902821.1 universal stress protein [Jiella sonneratiae]